jgi:hypothetical protein
MSDDISERCNTIEHCYEFMLAYAAQGLPSDEGSKSGGQIREHLSRAAKAISGLSESCATEVHLRHLEPAAQYREYFALLERDAQASLAAINLVLAQSSISSQLIDNLNASIHLRSLLTDLFLLAEIFKIRSAPAAARDFAP